MPYGDQVEQKGDVTGWSSAQERMAKLAGIFIVFMVLCPGVGQGASLKVSWNPNSETDLDGYEVAHGTLLPGVYTEHIDVGNVVEYLIEDVEVGVFHYVSVRAYDKARNYSEYSDEVSIFVPLFFARLLRHGFSSSAIVFGFLQHRIRRS